MRNKEQNRRGSKSRRKRRGKNVVGRTVRRYLTLITLFIFLLLGISNSFYFQLHTIKIKGCEYLTEELILNCSQLQPLDNIIWLKTRKIQQSLTNLPRIKEIEIHRLLPQSLQIEVIERKPKLQVFDGKYFLILDREQVVIDKTEKPVRSLPELKGLKIKNVPLGKAINIDKISYALYCVENEDYIKPKSIKKIIYDSAGRIYFYTNDNLKVKLGWPQELSEKMWQLSKVLKMLKNKSKTVTYIDIQVKDRPAIGEGEI